MRSLFATGLVVATCGLAIAESAPTAATRSEAEFLVPPQGGAVEVPVHAGAVCILSFPERMAQKALASSPDYEIKAWGEDGVAVRAVHDKVAPATLALATASGQIKVNVTLRVVPRTAGGLTLVRFKAASAEEAFEAQVSAAVQKRAAPIQAELAKLRKDLDEQVRNRADGLIAERLLSRNETVRLESHQRNDDHVIVHVRRGALLGDDGYLMFEIENRSRAAYRLAAVRVLDGRRDVAGPARLASTAIDRDPAVIGVVASGATARGVVVVRSASSVLGKSLAVELTGPDGRGKIRLDRGIVLR
ncbi:MAG: hypothetical protein ACTHU0_05185 [Kofleriaceae bacterium]